MIADALDGKTPAGICLELEKQGIPTPSGKENWCASTIWSILQNEKYKGDALLQIIKGLESNPTVLSEWDARLWIVLLDHTKVRSDGFVEFIFKNGSNITIKY